MTQSDMILEFIDGTLDPDLEQGLFDSLALQPDLRATLRQFITIGDAVRSDREAFVPPAFLERSLLGGLGLAGAATEILTSGAGVGAGAGAGAGAGVVAGSWITRILGAKGLVSMVASFVAGAILAAGGMFLTIDGSDDGRAGNGSAGGTVSGTVNGAAPQAQRQSAAPAQTPADQRAGRSGMQPGEPGGRPTGGASVAGMGASRRLDVQPPARTTPPSSKTLDGSLGQPAFSGTSGSVRIDEDAAPNQQADQSSADTSAATPSEPAEIAQASLRDADMSIPSEHLAVSRGTLPVDPTFFAYDEPEGATWKFEVRKHASWSLQQNRARTVPLSDVQRFLTEDIAFGSYHRLDENLAVGLEAGFDRYTQTLDVALGETLRVEQQPRFFWGGVALRYTGDRVIDLLDVRPFLQATGGATSVGPLLRTRLGTQFTLGMLSWNLAAEASSMVYRTNGQRQLTGRFGVTMGLEIGL